MVTIGDVLAVIGVVVATVLSLWALTLAVALLFRTRAERARTRIECSPGKVTLRGALMALVLGVLVAALLNHPNGLLKLVGWVVYLFLLVVGAVGFSGLVALVAQRLAQIEPSFTPYAALSRGALLCVLTTLVPILGWFVVAPLIGFASLGAGVEAIFSRTPALAPSASANSSTSS
ncbi:MAG: hypothetical protein RMM06_00105 [Armatimonadota bacterium]|nr:hypothetical protein [bacterium]MDW8289094.1 hypothetical protein [Armatimonadota bacterium]